MKTKRITMALLFAFSFTSMFGQNQTKLSSEILTERKFSISTTYYSFLNFGEEKTNTHHYEFHVGYKVSLRPNAYCLDGFGGLPYRSKKRC